MNSRLSSTTPNFTKEKSKNLEKLNDFPKVMPWVSAESKLDSKSPDLSSFLFPIHHAMS